MNILLNEMRKFLALNSYDIMLKKEEYYLIGDAQTVIEGPIQREQIFAVVTKVKRKGEWIVPEISGGNSSPTYG